MSSGEPRQRLRFLVSGRVQGVAFRYFTQRAARRLGLVGWVRNLPSGQVEVRAAGAAAALERFRRELRRGPAGARVDDLEEFSLESDNGWTGFEIVY